MFAASQRCSFRRSHEPVHAAAERFYRVAKGVDRKSLLGKRKSAEGSPPFYDVLYSSSFTDLTVCSFVDHRKRSRSRECRRNSVDEEIPRDCSSKHLCSTRHSTRIKRNLDAPHLRELGSLSQSSSVGVMTVYKGETTITGSNNHIVNNQETEDGEILD
ncbi:hypothetical protein Y032_0002g795 [Ancylostoma ceylanicum]|nr:hypothetical protein Y032_0002g795 [Ancylostoma ceylanicum]